MRFGRFRIPWDKLPMHHDRNTPTEFTHPLQFWDLSVLKYIFWVVPEYRTGVVAGLRRLSVRRHDQTAANTVRIEEYVENFDLWLADIQKNTKHLKEVEKPTLLVKPGRISFKIIKNQLRNLLLILKLHSLFIADCFIDMVSSDFLVKPRFMVRYFFLSLRYNVRYSIALWLNDLEFSFSIADLYPAAGWAEREIWDMHGIFFIGNLDLRRILTDYSFFGHPLRKDFPMTGFLEIFFDDAQKCVVYEKVELAQEYRSFRYI